VVSYFIRRPKNKRIRHLEGSLNFHKCGKKKVEVDKQGVLGWLLMGKI
jgi:hypothetical protein